MYFALRQAVLSILIFSSVIAQPSPVITLENADRLIPLDSRKAPVPGALSWSADGRWLAAAASSGLNIIDTTDSDRVVLTLPNVTTEVVFGADGTTFTTGGRLYHTLSGEILLENGVGWADAKHRIVFVNETPDTTTLYPVEYGEVGEEIITVPFPADRVVVPPLSTPLNGIFIRDIDPTNEENPFEGEVTVWRWNDPITLRNGLTARTEMIYSITFEWDSEPIVSISPDGAVAAINMFESIKVIDAYWGQQISLCDICYAMPYSVQTGPVDPSENTRLVVNSDIFSVYETPVILDIERGSVVSEWILPAMLMQKDSGRASTWDFTESHRFGAISSEQGIEVWQLDTPVPQQIAQLEGETVHAISEDGKRVLTGSADGLMVWSLDNLSAPKAVQIIPAQPNRSATFDRNNASAVIITYSIDGYEVWNEQPDGTWTASSSHMESGTYHFEGQGRFVIRTAGYPPSTAALFDSTTGETLIERPAAFAVWPDGETLAVWDNNVLRIINSADLSSRDVLTLSGVSGEFFAVNLPLDQAYILDTSNAELDVYAIQTGEYQFSIPVGEIGDYSFRLLFSANGKRVVLTPPASSPAIWDVSGSSAVLIHEVGEAFSSPISLNDDGTLLASGRSLTDEEKQALPDPTDWNEMVEVWDVESGAVIHSIQTLYDPRPIFVPDTDLLLIQARIYAEVWNLAAQPAVRQGYFDLDIDSGYMNISMSPVDFNEARTLALAVIGATGSHGGGESISVLIPLDLETQEAVPVTSLRVSRRNSGGDLHFSANETYALMSASNFGSAPEAVVYRFSDGASVILPGQVGAMSPDETLLATANPLRLWSVAELFTEDDPQPLVEYSEGDILSMEFSADGTLLYTWNTEGVTVWHTGE